MSALALTVFLASLLGSLHCAGMCGPLVAVYAGGDPSRGLARGASHLAYNLGRLVTYAALGAVAGGLGAALDLAGQVAGLQRVAAPLAGLFIAAIGVLSLLKLRGFDLGRMPVPPALRRFVGRVMGGVKGRPPIWRATILGLASAILPCGWLWAFAIVAVGTGGALPGALVMSVFWAGSVPIMVAVGVGIQTLAGPLRKRLPALSAIALVVVGLAAVFVRFEKLDAALALRRAPQSVEEAVRHVHDVEDETPACCDGEREE